MNATHVANPVPVMAATILEIADVTRKEPGYGQTSPDLMLRLSDGRNFTADSGMTARYVPVVGDYVVTQDDGYTYLNPKDVFERKYRRVLLPHQQRVVDEKAELDERLTKLNEFFTSFIFDRLDVAEQVRLQEQALHMQGYSNVLAARIAAF